MLDSSILAFLGSFLQALQGLAVIAQIDAVLALELIGNVIDEALVKVIAAQEGIAAGRAHLEDAVADIQDGDIERAAAQVVDRDDLILLLVQAIRQGRSSRLVDDAQHFQPGDLTGILGGIALGIVEIRRYRDDRLGNCLAQVGFGVSLELAKDHRRDFRRRVFLAAQNHADITIRRLCHLIGHPR